MNLIKPIALTLTLLALPQVVRAEMQTRREATVDRHFQHHRAPQHTRLSKAEKEMLAASYMSYFWNQRVSMDEPH